MNDTLDRILTDDQIMSTMDCERCDDGLNKLADAVEASPDDDMTLEEAILVRDRLDATVNSLIDQLDVARLRVIRIQSKATVEKFIGPIVAGLSGRRYEGEQFDPH